MKNWAQLWVSTHIQQGVARSNIEDCVFARNVDQERYAIFVLADGIGGLEDSELASITLCKELSAPIKKNVKKEMTNKILDLNAKLFKRTKKIGATLAITILDKQDHLYHAISIGDSRIYYHSKMKIVQIPNNERRNDSSQAFKGILKEAVGIHEEITDLNVHSNSFYKNDSFIICSDGVHSFLNDKTILEILQSTSKYNFVNELSSTAVIHNSQDDISIIYCKIF